MNEIKDISENEQREIADMAKYQNRMARSMMDKLFWVDKIPFNDGDLVLDFGCADGTLLRHASHWLPEATLLGYDSSPEALPPSDRTGESVSEHPEDMKITYQDDWGLVTKFLERSQRRNQKTTVVLSSLIHEVYHYGTPEDVDTFWQRVWGMTKETGYSGFDTIVIRDMMPGLAINRPSHPDHVAKVYKKFLDTKELRDFERQYGSITDNRNLTHFLLKYKYTTPNWEREVRENYLPLHLEDLMAMIPDEYEITFMEHYVLPYTFRQIREDLGISLRDNTHLKMILEKRK
jgi:hypothetical protein